MGRVLPFPRPRRPVRHLADVPPELWRALLERLQPERRARPRLAEVVDLATWRARRANEDHCVSAPPNGDH